MKLMKLLIVANLVMAAVVVGRWTVHRNTPHTMLMASWYHHAENLEGATGFADNIVTARVMDIEEAVLRPDGVRRGDTSQDLPGEVVTFQVTDRDLVGRASRGSRIRVFHLGRSNDVALSVEGDPDYVVGEEHVLFLMEGPTVFVNERAVETQVVISPEGRWKVDERRAVESPSDLEWARGFAGTPVRTFINETNAANRERIRRLNDDD